ncbi:MAG: restriction endonuclease subunit S [Neisseriaceae bacterium]|nr:restriction endonuclease subunit S [Neisseriaceae bacterium]
MNAYPQYKNTGVQWLGDIPEHWEVGKLGRILKPFSEKNHPDLPLLSITRELGVIERDTENQDENHNFIPDDLSGYKLLKKGQFGMNKMKAWQGSYGVSPFTGIVSPAYFVFDFIHKINPDFFHWAIRSKLYVSFFGSASDGVRIGQWDLSKSRMKNIPFVIPPLSEQTAIADFLEQREARIQKAVSLKNEQIAKLKEYRQALINQTVCQGLYSGCPTKNTNIQWLGNIPEHWEVKKLKYVLQLSTEKTESKKLDLRYIGMENIVSHTGELTENILEADGVANVFYKDEILFGKLRPYLSKVYLAQMNGICSTEFLVYKISKQIFNKFAFYLMICQKFIEMVNSSTYGTKMPRANSEFCANLFIPIPPISEQTEIAAYLDQKTAQIDTAIRRYQQQIALLKEYQQCLISDAVTGKIKVA